MCVLIVGQPKDLAGDLYTADIFVATDYQFQRKWQMEGEVSNNSDIWENNNK